MLAEFHVIELKPLNEKKTFFTGDLIYVRDRHFANASNFTVALIFQNEAMILHSISSKADS